MDSKSPEKMTQILPNLYLGNWEDSNDVEQLLKNQIKFVINVTPNKRPSQITQYFASNQIKEIQIPIKDSNTTDLTPYFSQVNQAISKARKKGNLLIHCQQGRSRSASFVIMYLMKHQKLTFDQAFKFVSDKRCICPNENFVQSLKKLKF